MNTEPLASRIRRFYRNFQLFGWQTRKRCRTRHDCEVQRVSNTEQWFTNAITRHRRPPTRNGNSVQYSGVLTGFGNKHKSSSPPLNTDNFLEKLIFLTGRIFLIDNNEKPKYF